MRLKQPPDLEWSDDGSFRSACRNSYLACALVPMIGDDEELFAPASSLPLSANARGASPFLYVIRSTEGEPSNR